MKKDWTYKKLGEICESDLGKTLNSKTDTGEYRPYLCAINVLWDKIDMSTLKTTKFETSELERYSVKKGDLLVCEGGDIGRAAIWNEDEPMQYQNALHRIRFNGDMLPRFFLMYLHNLKNTGVLDNNYGKGVTIKHLVKSSLLSIPVPVPPLSEQQHIVSELDLLQSIIDKQQAQLKEYDNLAQSIFYDMFGDPVANDKGWNVQPLGMIGKIARGVSKHRPRNAPELLGDYMPFIQTGDIANSGMYITNCQSGYSDLGVAQSKVWHKGTLCITIAANIGKCAIMTFDACFPDSVVGFIATPNKTLTEYVYFYFLWIQQALEDNATGVAQKNINLGILNNMNIPVPPLPLQQSFAKKIEAIEKQKADISQSIAETQKLFDYTMDKYFG